MKKTPYLIAVVTGLLIISACVTVNIYFPAAEVRRAAEEIARDVRGQEEPGEQGTDNQLKEPRSWFHFVSNAYAQQELSVSNATVRQLKAKMKARYPGLAPFFKKGVIGEAANGELVLRNTSGLGLRERAQIQRLTAAENADRKALYQAVAAALNISPSETARVGAIFAEEWQRTVPKGAWIETSPGKWKRK